MSAASKPDYDLLIDIGNTFLKWGLFRARASGEARENRLESGHLLLEEIAGLAAQFAKLPTPAEIVISNPPLNLWGPSLITDSSCDSHMRSRTSHSPPWRSCTDCVSPPASSSRSPVT